MTKISYLSPSFSREDDLHPEGKTSFLDERGVVLRHCIQYHSHEERMLLMRHCEKLLARVHSNPKTMTFDELDKILLQRAARRLRQSRGGSGH